MIYRCHECDHKVTLTAETTEDLKCPICGSTMIGEEESGFIVIDMNGEVESQREM